METVPHPPIVSREQWLADRKKLLDAEKGTYQTVRRHDRLAALGWRWSWSTKDYTFGGPQGKVRLVDMFDGSGS